MSQVGSLALNCHEGARSEYLAQYIFSALGTCIAIPHQEDTGIDLYCTLFQQVGQRAWPSHYFAVQVKSTEDPWVFTTPESIRWLIQFPLPLFFCVVQKKQARIRVYHTSPRFYVWSAATSITSCSLVPGAGPVGFCTGWTCDDSFSLSAPVLDFTIAEALQDTFVQNARDVLGEWIAIDTANLTLIQAGLRQFKMPASYTTNEAPIRRSTVVQGKGTAAQDELQEALHRIHDQLEWITAQLATHGDLAGALRGALLLRHLYPDDDMGKLLFFLGEITHQLGLQDRGYLFAGLDEINQLLTDRFPVPHATPAPTSFGGPLHRPSVK